MEPVTHFDIPFEDFEKARKFYQEIFGWKIQPMPEMNYNMVYTTEVDEKFMAKSPNKINGGMYKRNEKMSLQPTIVIDVKNIDESIKKIKQAGGEITFPKTQVGEMGYHAQFKDNQGNVLGIWQSIKKENSESKNNKGNEDSDGSYE